MNNIENRGGKPKKEDIIGTRFEIRISKIKKMLIDILSEKTGKSKSEIFRSGLQALYREEMDFER